MTSFERTTHHLADQLNKSASAAHGSLAELGTHALKLLESAHDRERAAIDTVLGGLGLQRRRSVLHYALPFAAGAVAIGAVVLAVSPAARKGLRTRVSALLGRSSESEPRVDSTPEPATNGATPAAEKPIGQVDRPRIIPTHQS